MLKLSTLADEVHLLLLKSLDFLLVIVFLLPLDVFVPEVVGSLPELVNFLLLVDQVKPQLVLHVGASR